MIAQVFGKAVLQLLEVGPVVIDHFFQLLRIKIRAVGLGLCEMHPGDGNAPQPHAVSDDPEIRVQTFVATNEIGVVQGVERMGLGDRVVSDLFFERSAPLVEDDRLVQNNVEKRIKAERPCILGQFP